MGANMQIPRWLLLKVFLDCLYCRISWFAAGTVRFISVVSEERKNYMQSKPSVVWFCFSNMLKRRSAGKHHSIKRNMRERHKKSQRWSALWCLCVSRSWLCDWFISERYAVWTDATRVLPTPTTETKRQTLFFCLLELKMTDKNSFMNVA